MVKVERRNKESIESFIRRFTRKVRDSNILKEFKERQYFTPKSLAKRTKSHSARKRLEKLKEI